MATLAAFFWIAKMLDGQMKKFIVIGLMIFVMESIWPPPGYAASRSTNFSCSVKNKICSCDVNKVGDCDGMKKNCKDGTIGWCTEINGGNFCFCDSLRTNGNFGNQIIENPAATAK